MNNTQGISHNSGIQSPYVAYPNTNKNTFEMLKCGDIIYKLDINDEKIDKYEIVSIEPYSEKQRLFELKSNNKMIDTYGIIDTYGDEKIVVFNNHTFDYKRELIGKNEKVIYFVNEIGLNEYLKEYIAPINEKINNVKQQFKILHKQ